MKIRVFKLSWDKESEKQTTSVYLFIFLMIVRDRFGVIPNKRFKMAARQVFIFNSQRMGK